MQVGCYTLDLYCDNAVSGWTCETYADYEASIPVCLESLPVQYVAEFGSNCRKQARRHGWTISGDKTICPYCNKKDRK